MAIWNLTAMFGAFSQHLQVLGGGGEEVFVKVWPSIPLVQGTRLACLHVLQPKWNHGRLCSDVQRQPEWFCNLGCNGRKFDEIVEIRIIYEPFKTCDDQKNYMWFFNVFASWYIWRYCPQLLVATSCFKSPLLGKCNVQVVITGLILFVKQLLRHFSNVAKTEFLTSWKQLNLTQLWIVNSENDAWLLAPIGNITVNEHDAQLVHIQILFSNMQRTEKQSWSCGITWCCIWARLCCRASSRFWGRPSVIDLQSLTFQV